MDLEDGELPDSEGEEKDFTHSNYYFVKFSKFFGVPKNWSSNCKIKIWYVILVFKIYFIGSLKEALDERCLQDIEKLVNKAKQSKIVGSPNHVKMASPRKIVSMLFP